MKKLFVTLLALVAMCLAPISYGCGRNRTEQGKDVCLDKAACTDVKTCSDKACSKKGCPDKTRSECGKGKVCPGCKDGRLCDTCKAHKACPDSKACDARKARKGQRRHHRGWCPAKSFGTHGSKAQKTSLRTMCHHRRHGRHTNGNKVSLQPRSEGAETSATAVAPAHHQAAAVSPIAPATAPVAGVIEKTGIIDVTHYGPWNKVDKVLFKTGGDVFKLVPTREGHHQLQEIKQYNGKAVNLKGEVCPIDRHHTEPAIKVHSISETK